MKIPLSLVFIIFLLNSCSSNHYSRISINAESYVSIRTDDKKLAMINNARLIKLKPGMSKSEVLQIMGTVRSMCHNNPLDISSFKSGEDYINVLYYFIKTDWDNEYWCDTQSVRDYNMKPLVLLNDKLIGWGYEALDRAADQYDIKIKKDFKINLK